MNRYLLYLVCICCLGCNKKTATNISTSTFIPKHPIKPFVFPYNVEEPSKVFDLPADLHEISGLSFSQDENVLYSIQDENGIIYGIDKQNGKVTFKKTFYKDGDYEGIELVGNRIFIVKSTGTIYEFNQEELSQDSIQLKKHKFFLTKENNIEGLCYNPKTKQLLLACKGNACKEAEEPESCKLQRAVYGFDVENNTMDPNPIMTLDLSQIQQFLAKNPKESVEEMERYHKLRVENPSKMPFCPSAIAIHPLTGHIYLLSSVGKMMIVLDQDGEIVFVQKLQKKIHRQPEGIVFDKAGNMYIANEGKDKVPKLLIYQPIQ